MTTRKFPRTLQEAFGPYTSRDIAPAPEPKASGYPILWWLAVCIIAGLGAYLTATTGAPT